MFATPRGATTLPKFALAFAAVWSLAVTEPSVAGTQFLTYEGRDAIQEGQGGDKKVVDGVDFWIDGSPPRRFQVLGSIIDDRRKSGLLGAVEMSGLEGDIAKRAKAAGGDAVILTAQQDDVQGYVGSSTGSAYSAGGTVYGGSVHRLRPVESHSSRYLVIKYLQDDNQPTATPAPATSR